MNAVPSPLDVDLLIIGYGRGGKTLAARLGRLGRRVVLVEQSDRMYGGTCVNVGCVPTRAVVHEGETRRGADDPRRWYTDAVSKVDALTTRLCGINFAMLDNIDAVTVITGHAVFTDAHTVEISAGEDRLTVRAESIVIGAGSEPVIPDVARLRDSSRLVTSTDLIATDALPNRLAVLGGGYLGVEFAAIYRRLGSDVTILEQGPALFGNEDDDIAEAATGVLADEGIEIITGARVDKVRDTARRSAVVSYADAAGQHELEVGLILAAAGRRPANGDLGLEAAGIATDARGAIILDQHLRSGQPHVFAIGDVNGGPQFTRRQPDRRRPTRRRRHPGGHRPGGRAADRVHDSTAVDRRHHRAAGNRAGAPDSGGRQASRADRPDAAGEDRRGDARRDEARHQRRHGPHSRRSTFERGLPRAHQHRCARHPKRGDRQPVTRCDLHSPEFYRGVQ
jgi:pyruvate/2-oxoglutarate dehydrogenase complex dihydrolipoamide dehydrogenase (E3) component